MKGTGDVDHSVIFPSHDELIESTVQSHVGDDSESNLTSFIESEDRFGLSCLGFGADNGFDCILYAFSDKFLKGRNANKAAS
jgi:hypothetical protein